MAADKPVLNAIFDKLTAGRPDVVRLTAKTEAVAAIGVSSKITVRIGQALSAMLEAGGVKVGTNETTGEIFPPPEGASYASTEQSTGLRIEPFVAGKQVLTVYPTTAYLNRLVRLEITSFLDAAAKRLRGMLLADAGVATLRFSVAADGKIALLDRPGAPRQVSARFNADLTVKNLTGNVAYQCTLTASNGAGLTSVASPALSAMPTKKNSSTPILLLLD